MRFQITALMAALALLMPVRAAALPDSNTIEFSNCVLGMPGTTLTATAQCGSLDVPEDPDQPDGRQISLNIAYAKATSTEVAPDPVFIFAGGPGQAATETWVMLRGTLGKIRRNRDIVMIDQRGTGGSNKLDCPPLEEEIDLNREIDLEQVRRQTEQCAANLDGDPRFYTTTHGMRDYDTVRRAMGYEQINLLGISYGTRSAQVYLRMFPDTVRTVTLDSVLPMQLALGQEHAPMLDRAVNEVFRDCREDADCNRLFPTSKIELQALLESLRDQPRSIVITNPTSGKKQQILFTAETLAVAVRFLSYSSESQAVLPLLLHEAVTTGDLSRLASQAILVMGGLTETLARGMELSVMCAEDYPFLDLEEDQEDTIIGNVFLEVVQLSCEAWPSGRAPHGFHEPVRSDVPVLLVSGQRDPVTPPHYAARVAETFPNSIKLVARGQSHSVLRHVCLRDIAGEFIEAGKVEGLDTSCVDDIRPSPFFTSLLGPRP